MKKGHIGYQSGKLNDENEKNTDKYREIEKQKIKKKTQKTNPSFTTANGKEKKNPRLVAGKNKVLSNKVQKKTPAFPKNETKKRMNGIKTHIIQFW